MPNAELGAIGATDSAPALKRRLDSLTSLRWLAATLVFLRHIIGLAYSPDSVMGHIASAGATGVSFFFVLSGFVLTWSYRQHEPVPQFYRRRFARIAPAYWLTALLALPIEPHGSGGELFSSLFPLTGLQAWVPVSRVYFGGNGVEWSVSAELFFYALFPFLVQPIGRMTSRVRAAVGVTAVVVIVALPLIIRSTEEVNGAGLWAIYILPLYRVLEFVIGILLAAALRDGVRVRVPLWVCLALTATAVTCAGYVPVYLMWVTLTIVPFALLIFVSAQRDLTRDETGSVPLLHRRWLIRLGEWSFAFYLLHVLTLRVVQKAASTVGAHLPGGAVAAISYVTAIAASYALYTLIEMPAERRLRHAPGRVEARA